MSTPPENSTAEQIIDKFDGIILNKLENNQSLDPNEQDRVTDILKIVFKQLQQPQKQI